MNKKKGMIGTFLSCLLPTGYGIIDYHPCDVKIKGERDINNKNIKKMEAKCLSKTIIRFVAMGDLQRRHDEVIDLVSVINERNNIGFVVHGGDLSDFGLTDEFLW